MRWQCRYAKNAGKFGLSEVLVDAAGDLADPRDGSESWATAVARAEGVELTEQHRPVLRFMRACYDERAVPPDARFVIKYLAATLGAPSNRLFELFRYGYVG